MNNSLRLKTDPAGAGSTFQETLSFGSRIILSFGRMRLRLERRDAYIVGSTAIS
jgi:hypothetical protein